MASLVCADTSEGSPGKSPLPRTVNHSAYQVLSTVRRPHQRAEDLERGEDAIRWSVSEARSTDPRAGEGNQGGLDGGRAGLQQRQRCGDEGD